LKSQAPAADSRFGHVAPTSEAWQTYFKIYRHEALIDGSVTDADIRASLLKPHEEFLATDLPAGVTQKLLDRCVGSIRLGRPFTFGQASDYWLPLNRVLLYLTSQLPDNPLLPVRATAAALLASWDRAASGWSLQLLIHTDDADTCCVFIRGNQALIKHPELAADGGVLRSDCKGGEHKTHGSSGSDSHGAGYGAGGSYGGYPDQWKGQTDPWTAYQQNTTGWGSGSQASWASNTKGWQSDGYGK
jgi:hypothetical protein